MASAVAIMENDDTPAVSAVQCSVIQYCSDVVQPSQVPQNGEPPPSQSEPVPTASGSNGCQEAKKLGPPATSHAIKEENSELILEIVNVSDGSDHSVSILEDGNESLGEMANVEIEDDNEVANSKIQTPISPGVKKEVVITEADGAKANMAAQAGLPVKFKEAPVANVKVEEPPIAKVKIEEPPEPVAKVKVERSPVAKVKVEVLEAPIAHVKEEMEENEFSKDVEILDDSPIATTAPKKRGRKQNHVVVNGVVEEISAAAAAEPSEEEESLESESDDEIESKPRRRGRCKKNPELVPSHLAPDLALGYTILTKFMDTPQFSVFKSPWFHSFSSCEQPKEDTITCLNQIKKKFDENTYVRFAEFVNDVRSLLTYVYEAAPRSSDVVKRAVRLEQLLEQRITQLPNYLRPQCSLILTADETSNSPQKIRINKGGGFVSLLQERADKQRVERDREKRKVLAEERKQLKEEQDKDVQDWEKNVLLKDHEEEIKMMWELPQIGHFIHLCANILNIGDVSQYEVERMLLMPQCSDTLDLIITALLSNSLMRAKLDRIPSMPYSIWSPLVRTRVNSWYRALHREFENKQKVFEEIGVEPEFWDAVGSEHSPLDHFFFHDIPLFQRVWILKTLCDVDFVRKKTVHDNIRQQLLEELAGTPLGTDRHGNRYIHFQQFGMTALRIYKQAAVLEDGMTAAKLIESTEGFEERSGEITLDKVFKDIWDVGTKSETPKKKMKGKRRAKVTDTAVRIKVNIQRPNSIRQSARAKRKVYVDSSDSEGSDTDLATLKNKLSSPNKSEKNFISLTVFRLPRDKVKVNKKSYYSRKLEREEMERLKAEERESKDSKHSGVDEDASESMDMKMEDDEDDEAKDNFTVKNLENLKMVLKKGNEDADNATDSSVQEDKKLRYITPAHLLPDKSNFYLVVDSVEGLRQLISQFSSADNDLEIVNRSRSGRKSGNKAAGPPSCEVQLIGRLQKLLEELESWEMDFIKTSRSIRDKLHKEYVNFTNRPEDFVHPNEAYWLKMYEEPAPQPPAEPEPPPVELPPPEPDITLINPPSPLGGLRPRTRTRQMQQKHSIASVHNMEQEVDEELDEEMFESSESDDNWEMPSKKRRKSMADSPRSTPKAARQSKRQPKKKERGSSPSSVDSDRAASDKAKKALFWSPRSSDPSEDLNWEKNRQKILEKHNSPQKTGGASGDIIKLIKPKVAGPRIRVAPPPIPGNRKPYFSAAQLKAMKNKDPDIEIIGSGPRSDIQVLPNKSPKRPRPTARAVLKKSAGTQSNEIIELDGDIELKPFTPRQRAQQQRPPQQYVNRMPQPQRVPQQSQQMAAQAPEELLDYYLTDGVSLFKVDEKFVQDMIKDDQLLRQSFGNKLDLSKPVHVVKKKRDGIPLTMGSSQQSTSKALIMGPGKPAEASVIKVVTSTPAGMIPETQKPTTGLRFIRPQNVTPNQLAFMKPTQVAARPVGRMPGPQVQNQPSIVYLPQSQTQGLIQIPAGMRGAEIVQLVTQRPMENSQNSQNQVNAGEATQIAVFSSATGPAQYGYIQVQAAGKQQGQLVQVSQARPQMTSSVQTSTSMAANNQNVVRIVSTTSGQTQSYVRLSTAGSQFNVVQVAGNQNPGFRQQAASVSSVGTSTVGTSTQASPVGLVQVLPSSNLPGEGISYVQLRPGGNLVQLQQTPSKQQPSPVGRLVQVQASQQTSPIVQQQSTGRMGTKLIQVPPPQRPQTTVFQTYAAPRMVQMQARPASQTRPQQGIVQVQSAQGGPRLQVSMDTNQLVQTQQSPGIQVQRVPMQQQGTVLQMQANMVASQGVPRAQTVVSSVGQNAGFVRPQGTLSLSSSPLRPATMQAQVQARPTLVRLQTSPRPATASNMVPNQTSVSSVATSVPMSVVTSVPISSVPSLVQVQSPLRPMAPQRQGTPGVFQVQASMANVATSVPVSVVTSVPVSVVSSVVQVQSQSRIQGSMVQAPSPQRQVNAGSLLQASMPTSIPSVVQVSASNAVQTSGAVSKLCTQLVQAGSNSPKPVGIQMMQIQPDGTLKPYVPQTFSTQAAAKPITAQILQVPAGAQLSNSGRSTQIVQMPMAGGKTGFFQIEGVPGQPMTIVPVQVVTSSQPGTTTTTSMKSTLPSIVQVQSPVMASNFIQVASPQKQVSSMGQLQNSTGLPQNSLTGAVPALTPQFVARPRQSQPRPTGGSPLQNRSHENIVRLVSPGPGLRLVGKPVQTVSVQQSLVRTPGTRMQASSNRVVSSQQQPVLIKLEEDEDDIKVVGGKTETVDILHGELSAKETPDGWRYSVKTSSGKDHVLTNEEVERRRAANNGRMF